MTQSYYQFFSTNIGRSAYGHEGGPGKKELRLGKIVGVARKGSNEGKRPDPLHLTDDFYYIIEDDGPIPFLCKCIKVDAR